MANDARQFSVRLLTFALSFMFGVTTAKASSLQTINPPDGGKIVYGQVDGQTTEAGAMGYILRNLHQSLGDRPKVGKLFDVHGSESVAVFFTVNRHDQGAGQPARPIAGMIIATKVTTDHVEAALVSDDAARFQKTLGPMMKTLFGVWHPLRVSGGGGSGSAGPAQLHQVVVQDRSAAISLPDGWQLNNRMSGEGTIVASGPNGESAEMGIAFNVGDTNNPSVQRILQTLRNGGLRNTAYANANYYPYNSDPAKTFEYLIQTVRKKAGLPQATYHFTSVKPTQGSGQERCAEMEGQADMNDGSGPKELRTVFCEKAPNRFGTYGALTYGTMVPVKLADRERATLGAIQASFNVDMRVVNDEARRISQPEIDRIHAIGAASAKAAADAHRMEDIHNSSVYQHWDSIDKRSQEFENYQLNYAVISTTDHQAHGTFDADEAAALVHDNPDKFEYVSAPDYWKGIDY